MLTQAPGAPVYVQQQVGNPRFFILLAGQPKVFLLATQCGDNDDGHGDSFTLNAFSAQIATATKNSQQTTDK